jgi:hypothetical protein
MLRRRRKRRKNPLPKDGSALEERNLTSHGLNTDFHGMKNKIKARFRILFWQGSKSYIKRFREDVPDYYGQITFADDCSLPE